MDFAAAREIPRRSYRRVVKRRKSRDFTSNHAETAAKIASATNINILTGLTEPSSG